MMNSHPLTQQQLIFKHLKVFLKFTLTHIYVLAAVIGLFVYIFYINANKVEESYTARISFMLADEDMQSQPGAFNLASQLGLVNQQVGSNKAILKELLDSRKLIENTLFYEIELNKKKDLLINHYIILRSKLWGTKPDNFFDKNYKLGDDDNKDSYLASLAWEIKSRYTSVIRESGFFDLSFTAPDEYFTKKFLETHLISLSDYYKEKRTQRAMSVLKFAQRRSDSLSGVLAGKENAVASSIDNNILGIMSITKVPELRNKRNVELVSKLYGEAVLNLESAKMSVVKETPMIQVIDDIRFPLQFNGKPMQKNITIGVLIGFFLGLLLTLVWYAVKNFKSLMADFQPKPKDKVTYS
ncbi:MAG: hypothetical protein HQ463_08635 [Bacteroidetes bacterium]|nr:hypothetical protein [Bacteroidota bacterium]